MDDKKVFEKARIGDVEFFETNLKNNDFLSLLLVTDEDGRTLLHNAVMGRNTDLVEFLLIKGFSDLLDSKDDEGWSPLHSAASMGLTRMCELMLSYNATVDIKTNEDRTPLHYAASKGHGEIIKILLRYGASANKKDKTGSTPLHRAAGAGKLESAQLLASEGNANIDIEDITGSTPLIVALSCGNDSVSLYLASLGANLEAMDKEGKSVAKYAGKLYLLLQAAAKEEIEIE